MSSKYFLQMYTNVPLSAPDEHNYEIRRLRAPANRWQFIFDNTLLIGGNTESLINSALPRGRAIVGTEAADNRRVALNLPQQYVFQMFYRRDYGSGFTSVSSMGTATSAGCSITGGNSPYIGFYLDGSGTC